MNTTSMEDEKAMAESLDRLNKSLKELGFALVGAAYGILAWGFVITKLWSWFILPIAPSAPALTYAQAIGIWVLVLVVKSRTAIKKEYKDEKLEKMLRYAGPWFMLLVGWIVSLFL